MPITINGRTEYVPGVYGTIEVIQKGAVALPVFNGLLLVGTAPQGIGYDAGNGADVIKSFSNTADAGAFFGNSSPLVQAFAEAKKGGAGVVHMLCANALTRASAAVNDGTNPLFTVKPKVYGVTGNDQKLDIVVSSNTVTVTITKALSILTTANVLITDTLISLETVEGLSVGDSVYLLDSSDTASGTPQTINYIDVANKQIVLTTTHGNACTTANFARIVKFNQGSRLVKVFDKTATGFLNDLVNFINSSGLFEVSSISTTAVPGNIVSQGGMLGLIVGATKGTSPAATMYESALIAKIPQLLEEWSNATKVRIRIILPVTDPITNVLGAWTPLTTTMRAAQKSIQLVLGSPAGAIANAITSSSNPAYQAKYNCGKGDIIYCGMGYDGKAAYLTTAPFVAGLMSGQSVKLNLTRDKVPATTVEKTFGEFNKAEAETYIKSGVIIIMTGKDGFYIAQGVNTYQNQATTWNQNDNDTYLIQQRQLADFIFEGYNEQMQQAVGGDTVNLTTVGALGVSILQKYQDEGFCDDKKITAAYKEGNAIITLPEVQLPQTVDFIGYKLRVVVPN